MYVCKYMHYYIIIGLKVTIYYNRIKSNSIETLMNENNGSIEIKLQTSLESDRQLGGCLEALKCGYNYCCIIIYSGDKLNIMRLPLYLSSRPMYYVITTISVQKEQAYSAYYRKQITDLRLRLQFVWAKDSKLFLSENLTVICYRCI